MNIDEIMSLANTYARLIVRGSDEEVHDSYHKLQAAIAHHVAEAVAAEREECARIMEAQDIDPSFRNRMVTAIRARAEKETK